MIKGPLISSWLNTLVNNHGKYFLIKIIYTSGIQAHMTIYNSNT